MPMLAALADLAHRRSRAIAVGALAIALAAAWFGASTPSRLESSDNDFQDSSSESFRTLDLLSRATHVLPGPSLVVVAPPREARAAAAQLRRDPAVARLQAPAAVSRDGRLVLVAAWFRTHGSAAAPNVSQLARSLPGIVGGAALANEQVGRQSERDLVRAELIAFPLLLLLALWIFRGVVAALLPVAAGLLALLLTLALLRLVNDVRPISVFALNLVTGAAIGLAIDYSLLLVTRYREELARRGPGREPLRATLATAGRTVAFSAGTVAAAFASLLVFPLPFLRSMAIGGIIVAPLAGLVALVLLPGLFALLGARVNVLAPRRWQRAAERAARAEQRGAWYRFARWVMARPARVALGSAALLVALGVPFLGVRFVVVDASVLPSSSSARRADDTLRERFAPGLDAPLHLLVRARSPAPTIGAIRRLTGVSRVAAPQRVAPGLWTVDVVPRTGAMSEQTKQLVRDARGLPGVAATGRTAWYLDTAASLRNRLPLALALLALTTFALLYLVTGSLVLPLKTLAVNVLGLSAAFGMLVLVFQDGRLEWLLRYRSQGALELTQPVLLFAIAFGLATDYGVFLLSRIKEAHDAGLPNREAVALGLERTGRVITAAALLFCVAVGAFATSGVLIVKELGLGIAFAVAIDASLVRALLVPSLMALLGDWNWWPRRQFRR
ncbi:MAG: MMPL family transporter [Thermoleophilia bacterium]|nr:MMPL family transporter [Thermoleophilia bacterium]